MVSVIYPEQATNAVIAFVVIDLFLSPISDIADEFYGAKLAEAGEDEALAFNASLYSLLGLLGLVIASPLGAVLSGFSVSVLLFSNIILSFSLFGAAFRSVARRSAPVGPLQNIHDEPILSNGRAHCVETVYSRYVSIWPSVAPALFDSAGDWCVDGTTFVSLGSGT